MTRNITIEFRAINNYAPLVIAIPLTKKAQKNDKTLFYYVRFCKDFVKYTLFAQLQKTNKALTLYPKITMKN